ncbi:MAG: response regulator [Candidatus Gracilibacteria bacterium]|nr:response regulator [Candidatus Gracilibacteria bacterium]MDD5179241.1 response regulator [Candidatus Gracilibacteria bacterium]
MENPPTLRLLVAEDDKDVSDSLAMCFEILTLTKKITAELEILFAANGEEALEILQDQSRGKIDALLTDLEMPKMNGAKLIAELRKINWQGKITMMSGNKFKAQAALAELGISDIEIHDKPIFLEKLIKIIEKFSETLASPQSPATSAAAVGNA